MQKSRSTPVWKGGYWKSKKPESEASLDTQEAETRSRRSFEELIIPNRTRLPSWNKAPKPQADDYQIALNLLRLQSSRSSLAPSSSSHPPNPLSRQISKLRNSASSPTPLTLHRCSNPSIKIYPLSEVTQESPQVKSNREETPLQPIGIAQNEAFYLQDHCKRRGNDLDHPRIQDSDRFDTSRRLGQGITSDEMLNVDSTSGKRNVYTLKHRLSNLFLFLSHSLSISRENPRDSRDIEPFLESQQTGSPQSSPDSLGKLPLVKEDSRAPSSHGSINSIRPISEHTVGLPSATTLESRSSPADVASGPATQFQITNIADFNSVLGTDAFEFPCVYGPTTLRLASCLVPLFNEIVYGYAPPVGIFIARHQKNVVKKYCAHWITELQHPGILWGTESIRAVPGSSKVSVIRDFLAKATVTDCGAALIRLLEQLPGGILGNFTTFRHLASLIELYQEADSEVESRVLYDAESKAKAVALYMLSINDPDQRDLIIAVFSLCSLLATGEREHRNKSWTIAKFFAPVLLNGKEEDVEVKLCGVKRSPEGNTLRIARKRYQVVRDPGHLCTEIQATPCHDNLSTRARRLITSRLISIRRHIPRRILLTKPKVREITKQKRLLLEYFIVEMIAIWQNVNKELTKDIESAVVVDSDNESKYG